METEDHKETLEPVPEEVKQAMERSGIRFFGEPEDDSELTPGDLKVMETIG